MDYNTLNNANFSYNLNNSNNMAQNTHPTGAPVSIDAYNYHPMNVPNFDQGHNSSYSYQQPMNRDRFNDNKFYGYNNTISNQPMGDFMSPSNSSTHNVPSNNMSLSPVMRKTSKGKPENICQLLHTPPNTGRTLSIAGLEYEYGRKQEIGGYNTPMRKISLAANMKINTTSPYENLEPENNLNVQKSSINADQPYRKKSSMAAPLHKYSSSLRNPKFQGLSNPLLSLTPYTPPPMLSPRRSGAGLYCQILIKSDELDQFGIESERKFSKSANEYPRRSNLENHERLNSISSDPPVNRPLRKTGMFISGQDGDEANFAMELENLRKESTASTISTSSNLQYDTSASYYRPKAIGPKEDSKKRITDEDKHKTSVSEDKEVDDVAPPESDATPHINLGKSFQARVRKWADREITSQERNMIPDRDEAIFDCKCIDHLSAKTVAAYEALACSACVPRPGRNKELALHILMENKGNIQAAVMDLLRSDTLDWDQYPIIFNNKYADTDNWSPEDIGGFQDAIYKSEKDFKQVASDLGNRTVKECISFYYTWKKVCPDDYRKLRNLRRKRQLLEQTLDISSFVSRNRELSENHMETSEDELSETESDATNPYMPNFEYSPQPKPPNVEYESITPPEKEKINLLKMPEPSTMSEERNSSTYHWLHEPKVEEKTENQKNLLFDLRETLDRDKAVKVNRNVITKKGAQPADDGFFHCRLCDKRFEKVKSLNAHMKSHAMKARAEAEAQQTSMNSSSSKNFMNFHLGGGNMPEMKRPQFEQHSMKSSHDLLGPMPQISANFGANRTFDASMLNPSNPSFNRLAGYVPNSNLSATQLSRGLDFVVQQLSNSAANNPNNPLDGSNLNNPDSNH